MSKVYLHLTEECNMACKYCYMQNLKFKGSREMSLETAIQAVDYMATDENWNVETIIFFGGEPMLKQGLIQEVTEYVNKAYADRFHLSMITNGTLLNDDFMCFARKNDMSLVLSFDGAYGPRNRVDADGKERLLVNKDWIEQNRMSALSVIDPSNVRYLHDNVKYMRDLGFERIQHVTNYEGDWTHETLDILACEWGKITDDYINWKKAKEKIVLARLDIMVRLYMRKFILSNVPEFRPLMAVSVLGDIFPYPGAVGNPALKLGNVVDGFDVEKVGKLHTLPNVTVCEGCDIEDICPSAKGNILLDNLTPYSHDVSCEGYKVMVDCAEKFIDEMI